MGVLFYGVSSQVAVLRQTQTVRLALVVGQEKEAQVAEKVRTQHLVIQ